MDDLAVNTAYQARRKVGAWLRERRLAAGLEQEQVARHIGIGHAALSAVEMGRCTISMERYLSLVALLGIPGKEFRDGLPLTGPPEPLN